VKIVSDILMAFDHGDITSLALLYCSAAFDTVHHDILLRKLSESFGVDDTAVQGAHPMHTTPLCQQT